MRSTSGLNSKTAGPVLQPERSRLPVDPFTYYVDIMICPSGLVVQGGPGSGNGDYISLSPASSQPFYHFWLTEREGVSAPLYGSSSFNIKSSNPNYGQREQQRQRCPQRESHLLAQRRPRRRYMLPMPKGTTSYTPPASPVGERHGLPDRRASACHPVREDGSNRLELDPEFQRLPTPTSPSTTPSPGSRSRNDRARPSERGRGSP